MHDPAEGLASDQLDEELIKTFRRAVTATYDTLAKMGLGDSEGLDEYGPIEMAHRLLKGPRTSPGFARLWEMGKLHMSIEALVLRKEFQSLFTDAERNVARERLVNKGYEVN